ncbi:unnamed protein product [Microthlaspi erraticum]|uniref:RING-type domain-containing protein n=1 Tax=Microthlaspi erraticum TaxID=1685480 RepID=A0A6D2I905_9BRAS|nr:unnamed protein product [Microthlaspi erraticum]
MDEVVENLVMLAMIILICCGGALCFICLDSDNRRNNDHPTDHQPPRSFHELIQTIKPTGTYKPPPPRPIPVVKFKSRDFKDGVECVVCLSELAEGDEARVLPTCNHCFHAYCIDTWLQSNSNCPVCRKNVVGRLIPNHGSSSVPRTSSDANPEVVIDIPS